MGITPACAGKSGRRADGGADAEDHPRVCGEKPGMSLIVSYRGGSPPRVRGKAIDFYGFPVRNGITPACAGKSFLSILRYFLCGDHPRVCGEKVDGATAQSVNRGSPPRVRGKVGCTHANVRWMWDHPRVCGEKTVELAQAKPILGSPPRVRGKEHYRFCGEKTCRITPACAGKSLQRFRPGNRHGDHPRVCGEKNQNVLLPPSLLGSPPRVRGKGVHSADLG